MNSRARHLWQAAGSFRNELPLRPHWTCRQSLRAPKQRRRRASTLADGGNEPYNTMLDEPPRLVRIKKEKHGPGLIILALIPTTAFALGTWQIYRLGWKTELMARFEDRLVREPLPLPLYIDQSVLSEFDYRRVYATGKLCHDQEMLVGPRMREGENGYLVVTPLEREEVDAKGRKHTSKILVCRGWITKDMKHRWERVKAEAVELANRGQKMGVSRAVPDTLVTVQGLLREPYKKNYFTPANNPAKNEWHFMDIVEMAQHTGSQPVWIEETMQPDLVEEMARQVMGIPIGRPPEVHLSNNHTQYIFTWYGLSFATSIMFYMLVRKKPSGIHERVKQSKHW